MADGSIPTYAERGRMGGAPMRTGSVQTVDGGTLASVHVKRLRKVAESLDGRPREHVEAAIACMQTLVRKNRRLGGQVGGMAKRKLLTHRGVMLSGPAEDVAADIAELAAVQPVTVYRLARRFRVTTQDTLPGPGERQRVGLYDAGCDYRHVLDDVQAAMA